MIAKGLVGRSVDDFVGDVVVGRGDHKGVVVLIGWFLATDVFLRDADGQSHRLTLPIDGVGRGVVGAPAGTQALVVGELHGALDIDDASGEETVRDVLVEEHIDISIAMACVLGVADGHIHPLPTTVVEFNDGAEGTVGDDALGAGAYGVDHCGLLAVPASEGAQSEGVAHPQHVVAIALCLLLL